MGRQPCCDKVGLKKGPWTAEEDKKLINFILANGKCCWRAVPKLAGLLRCGKSCRLRWTNYLRPDLKRGLLSEDEEKMVIDLHAQMGNRWSKIASHLPGRTDNEIKNHWNTHIKKKLKKMGIDPITHMPLPPQTDDQVPQEYSHNQELPKGTSEFPLETSIQSTITDSKEEEREEGKCINTSPLFDPMNNGFCIDEVTSVDTFETLVTSTNSLIYPSSSSTSSSTTSLHGDGFPNVIDDLEILHPGRSSTGISMRYDDQDLGFMPNLDLQVDFSDNMCFWDDYMMNTLSFLMENDYDTNFDVQIQPPSDWGSNNCF